MHGYELVITVSDHQKQRQVESKHEQAQQWR